MLLAVSIRGQFGMEIDPGLPTSICVVMRSRTENEAMMFEPSNATSQIVCVDQWHIENYVK
jgi:hypothetical protein